MPKERVGWHHRLLGIQKLWDAKILGAGIRVAILDTGQGSVSGLQRPGFQYFDDGGVPVQPSDVDGHGTAAASVVACGTNGLLGIAPRCLTASYRVTDGGDSAAKAQRAFAAIIARPDDIDVVLCAFVLSKHVPAIAEHVRTLAMRGVVVVASAGNSASASSAFPELTPHAITVAGVTQQRLALPGAKRGPWIDISAPGEAIPIVSASDVPGVFKDTSAAASVVAGVAALVLGHVTPKKRRQAGRMFEGVMVAKAAKLPNTKPDEVGAGLINPAAIISVIQEGL